MDLPQGRLYYRDSGSGPPLVFLHGLLVNGLLWRKVVAALDGEFRCVVPELPLGSHPEAMHGDADSSPRGVARLVADFLAALELDDVTLVGSDTGGAVAQLVAVHHGDRLGRLVLTPCDAYENFLPPLFRYLQVAARVPGATAVLLQTMRVPALRRSPNAFGWLTKRAVDREVMESWVGPARRDAAVRRDLVRFLRSISARDTVEAAERLRSFDRPVLLAWAPEDRSFPWRHAERLAATIPDARLERIEDSYAFVSEDQPVRTAALIADFVRDTRRDG